MRQIKHILDNSVPQRTLGGWLHDSIQQDDDLRIVSAYFTIYGYAALRERLEAAASTRFLFGDPSCVGNVDPAPEQEKTFLLTEGGVQAGAQLTQKWAARECETWVKKDSTQIRTMHRRRFLHGKMYHLSHANGDMAAVSGSSNFTQRGLGISKSANFELNTVASAAVADDLKAWFDQLWDNKEAVEDAKDRVLAALNRLGEDKSPQFIYYKTLYHLFEDRLQAEEKNERRMERNHFYQTAIWRKLYQFQRKGVIGAINRLMTHNGCIIADSVGLGKTFEALAVIKYFELQNQNVLVLCPKRLRENWTYYIAAVNNINNPLASDKFAYHVLSHTDLGRKSGMVGDINLENFNWGNYQLVVIDESHNFRNVPSVRKTAEGEIRESRYPWLRDKVLKAGAATKVLMLSATPVNNTLNDLHNQVRLITNDDDAAFAESLELPSLKKLLRNAQKSFEQWHDAPQERETAEQRQAHQQRLLDSLGDGFTRLLDGISIARSRRHVEQFYKKFLQDSGGFPKRQKPLNEKPKTDLKNELRYDDVQKRIADFKLAIYHPSDYVIKDTPSYEKLSVEKKQHNFNQLDRERYLIHMMQVNFLKRLESSVAAFALTLSRTIGKINKLEGKIIRWKESQAERETPPKTLDAADTAPDEKDISDDDDADTRVGGGLNTYPLEDLRLGDWLDDLRRERDVLNKLHALTQKVDAARDGKLQALRAILQDKVDKPTTDKDGVVNRKVLVFTSAADTAEYLYSKLKPWATDNKIHIAQLAGSGRLQRNDDGRRDFQQILSDFAPRARERRENGGNIDILIATDCISEGQNLQDCDMVVNYDIHWNPVRLIQRFGRIDRLGSRNHTVRMVNFWPPMELDDYLNLQKRVHMRMKLADITATGRDNLLGDDEDTPPDDKEKKTKQAVQGEMDFRSEQMRRLQNEVLDLEDMQDGLQMSDFTLEDFLADLLAYMENNREALKSAPLGLFAVTAPPPETPLLPAKGGNPGTIFCMRTKVAASEQRDGENSDEKEGDAAGNKKPPCYLAYIGADNEPRALGKPALSAMRAVARDVAAPNAALAAAFDARTENGKNMEKETAQVERALTVIKGKEAKEEANRLKTGGMLTTRNKRGLGLDDYELITWLVIEGNERGETAD